MLAKRFFYVSAALFLLAMTYHLGARSAGAQASGQVVAVSDFIVNGTSNSTMAITSGGDVYTTSTGTTWAYQGNIFGVGPTPTATESWGSVKDRYRK